MTNKSKRICALLICGLFVLTLLFSSVYIVRAANHCCCGVCCLVCSVIAHVEEMLHGLVILLPMLAAMAVLAAAWMGGDGRENRAPYAFRTLVQWKIRLND